VGFEALVVAVRLVEDPRQIVAEFTLTVGNGFTLTVPDALLKQVVTPSVTVTE